MIKKNIIGCQGLAGERGKKRQSTYEFYGNETGLYTTTVDT